MLLIAPLSASAEEAAEGVTEGETVGDEVIDTPAEEIPTDEEIEGDGEVGVPDDVPTDDPTFEEEVKVVTDEIVKWLEDNSALLGMIVTLIGYGIVTFNRLSTIIKSASTMNNNAIAIAKNSKDVVDEALTSINSASGAVTNYDARIMALLEAFKTTAEDKARLEKEFVELKNYLKTSTDANIEFANELAELLGLANIPNHKKEEIGARHLEHVKAILEAQKKAEAATMVVPTEEVKEDVGEEKEN
jgi:hypothetical protein